MIHSSNNHSTATRMLVLLVLCLMQCTSRLALPALADNRLYIEPVVGKIGKTVSVPLQLANDDDVVAAQFDVTLPFAMPSSDVLTLTNRSNGHAVSTKINGKTITCILASMQNNSLKGNSGIILRIPMATYDDGNTAQPYTITLSNIVLTDKEGHNIATESTTTGTFTASKDDCPDLTLSSVVLAPQSATLTPGKDASVNYTVHNSGDGATKAGWVASIYLESEITGIRTFIGSQSHDALMAAGSSVTKTLTVTLPSAMHMDGPVHAIVEVKPASGCGELIADQGNNTAYSDAKTLSKLLFFTTNKTTITEGSSSGYATLTLTRSGDWSLAESFTLTSSVAGLFCLNSNGNGVLPAEVVIPKGVASTTLRLYAVNDAIVRAREADILIAAAHGYEGKSLHLLRTDNDRNPLSLTLSKSSLTEGESFVVTATRGGELTDELTLPVACNQATRFTDLPFLTFAAGQSVATAVITAIDDNAPHLDCTATFSAAATDYYTASAALTLLDNDRPTLKLEVVPAAVNETAGNQAAIAVVSRTGNTTLPLCVRLTSSRSEVFFAQSVVEIPAGQSKVEVNVGVTDNAAVDGTRTTQLTAAAYIQANNAYAASDDRAYTTATLTINDDESPYLALTARQTTVAEGSAISLTVQRVTPSYSQPLTVQLSSTASDITFPASVTIPAGSSSASFTLTAAKNTTTDDDREFSLIATGNGVTQGAIKLCVSDRTLPDATIATVGHTGDLYSGLAATFSACVRNVGTAALPQDTRIDFYLSNSSRLGYYVTSTPLLSTTLGQAIDMGAEANLSFTANVPQVVGTYWLYAVVNADGAVSEFSRSNNTVAVFEQVYIAAPFAVSEIATDKTDYLPGEHVQVTGKMVGRLNGQTVRLRLEPANTSSSGQYSYTDTRIDAEGNFSASILTDRSAYGTMKVYATALGQTEPAKSVDVNIYQMSLSSSLGTTLTCDEHYQKTGYIRIYNRSAKPLTGLTLTAGTLPYGCGLTLAAVPSTLAAGSYADVAFTVDPTVAMTSQLYESFSLKATCAEGLSVELPFSYLCRATSANIAINPSPLATTLLLESSRSVEVTLTNYGLKETGSIALHIPADVKWLSSLSPADLPSLAPGQSTTIRLLLTHREGMHSGSTFTSQLNVNCENGAARTANVQVKVVGTEYSTLTLHTADVYSIAHANYSHLAGANVKVKNARGETVFSGLTDQSGQWTTDRLTEGNYTITLSAERHNPVTKTLSVGPGEDAVLDFILPYQAVLTNFVTTQDLTDNSYRMVSTILIDYDAPQAIVVPDFGNAAFDSATDTVQVVLHNVGSRTALLPHFVFPASLEGITMEALNGYPATLNPGEKYVVSLRYTCPTNLRRRLIASMSLTYGFTLEGHSLSESDLYQQLVGSIYKDNDYTPELPPIILPEQPGTGSGADTGNTGSQTTENLAEGTTHDAGTALPSVDGWVNITYEDIEKAMTGQPIHATLSVRNGNSRPMTGLRFMPEAYDYLTDDYLTDGITFRCLTDGLTGFTPTGNGLYTLEADTEGSLPLEFVPEERIAPDGTRRIILGGQLAYYCGGIQSTATLPYIVITVQPLGKVQLTYLVQRDFVSDDLTTDAVEAQRPAELVMLMTNTGGTTLRNLTVRNADLKVVANANYRPIAYNGLSATTDGAETNLDFAHVVTDSLEASRSQTHHWLYAAEQMAHVSQPQSLATYCQARQAELDTKVSIEGVYELFRSVCATHTGNAATDTLSAADLAYEVMALSQTDSYLVNLIDDEDRLPDAVVRPYSAEPLPLAVVNDKCTISGTSGVYTLTLRADAAGWVYGRLHDPTNGRMMLTSVKRVSDGASVATANFWQTDRTVAIDYSVINENLIHFADSIASTSETYTLTFTTRPGDKLKVTNLHLLTDDGTEIADGDVTTKPVTTVRVEFNKPVRSVGAQYVMLQARGENRNLGDNFIERTNYQDYLISLEAAPLVPGLHVFSVNAAKLRERTGGAYGEGMATITWTEDLDIKADLDICAAPDSLCGTVTPASGAYSYGTLELKAEPKPGYAFSAWTVNGKQLETTDPYLSYNVEGPASIRALFVPLGADEVKAQFNELLNAPLLDILEGSIAQGPADFAKPTTVNEAITAARNVADYIDAKWNFLIGDYAQIIRTYLEAIAANGPLANCKFEMKGAYSTLILASAADLPEGLTLYSCEATEADNLTLVLTPVTGHIAPNVPYIVEGLPGSKYTLIGWDEGIRTTHSSGWLTGVLNEGGAIVPADSYVLALFKSGRQGFYRTDGTVTCPSHKCYLTVPPTLTAAALYLPNSTTGIDSVMGHADTEPAIYNTAGQRRNKLEKGINIVGGIKVIVK